MTDDLAAGQAAQVPEFAARRAAALEELDAIDPARHGRLSEDPLRRGWFGEVYARAGEDAARVPWGNLAPHVLTRNFVGAQLRGLAGLRVLDIGCGLGDNAECFAEAGADVVAFDFVPEAISWVKRRFPESRVDYRVADLFALPPEWRGGFDVVHECYTLQALAPSLLAEAFAAFAAALRPGGALVLISRARDEQEAIAGPPWPLPPSVFELARRQGFSAGLVEDVPAGAGVGRRHWRAVLRRLVAA